MNSPTTDEELRANVLKAVALTPVISEAVEKLMTFISQHTVEAELRARIDEMKEAKKWASKADEVYQVEQQLSDSIVRLEHRLKELDNATE